MKQFESTAMDWHVLGIASRVGCQQAPPPAAQAPARRGGRRHVRRRRNRSRRARCPDAFHCFARSAKISRRTESIARTAPESLENRRKRTDEWRAKQSAEAKRLFPVKVEETNTAGVRTDIITPLDTPAANRDRVLINLHGGGFNSDSGSLIEGVPIANLAKIKVVSVYYRLAPENPFPAAVDDVVAVYKELLKTYKPKKIGIFGTSAGATLTAEVASKLKQAKLPDARRTRNVFRASRLFAPDRFASKFLRSEDSPALSLRAIQANRPKIPTPDRPIAKTQCCRPFSPI